MFKYEMHIHTSPCSACATSTAAEMVDSAKEAGYSGFVLTNHFYHGNTGIDRNLPWNEFVKPYVEDYLKAKEYGKKVGIDVFFGIEEGYGNGKEALVYGIDPNVLAKEEALREVSIKKLSDFVRKNGGFIACAHPFRHRAYITDADTEPDMQYFDALEVFNQGNSQQDNKTAEDFRKKYSLKAISGGDHHNLVGFLSTLAGIATENKIKNEKELVEILKNGNYKIISSGKI